MNAHESFLAIGECMVEMAPAEGGLYSMGFAGDTFNTAWYARRLLPREWRVGYCSAVGDDAASGGMLAFMREEGVETSAIRRIEGRAAGLYMIQVKDGERSFSYWRGQAAAKALADDPGWLEQVLAGRGVLYFSGVTMAILAPEARERLCAALMQARAEGATVAFDTNLRPRLWEGREAMRAGLMQGAAAADIVLPSFDEEQWLWEDATPGDTIARYADAGAGMVAVKNASAPCHLWTEARGETVHAVAAAAKVVDSTAAGDSFGAAFMAAVATGSDLGQAVEQAAALAAKVIGERGALARGLFEGRTA